MTFLIVDTLASSWECTGTPETFGSISMIRLLFPERLMFRMRAGPRLPPDIFGDIVLRIGCGVPPKLPVL
jgi:hypothetical protein